MVKVRKTALFKQASWILQILSWSVPWLQLKIQAGIWSASQFQAEND